MIYIREQKNCFSKKEGNMFLSDSSGVIIDLGVNEANWTLGRYYNENKFIPSRHKLYVILDEKVPSEDEIFGSDIEDKDDDGDEKKKKKRSCLVYTEPVIEVCGCGRPFRTYIPDTMCTLPDGGIISYPDAQTTCLLCDDGLFGLFMNKDLFPELSDQ